MLPRLVCSCAFCCRCRPWPSGGWRVALVLAATDYKSLRKLDNPVNDALAVEGLLSGPGFAVTVETNRDLRRMRRALDDFREDGAGADVALLFYAGHGIEIAGVNYLLPVDAQAGTADAVTACALPLSEVQAALVAVAPVVIVLLGACRNDPWGNGGGGNGGGGGGRSAVARLAELSQDAEYLRNWAVARVHTGDMLLLQGNLPGASAALHRRRGDLWRIGRGGTGQCPAPTGLGQRSGQSGRCRHDAERSGAGAGLCAARLSDRGR